MTFLLAILGLGLLVGGAELLVRGAAGLAGAAGITPLVIGLTVVAAGTSAPELAVSLQGALSGRPDLAVGNVVGSNLANVLLILGASALIAPLTVSRQVVRVDVPLMIGASLLLVVLAEDGRVGRLDGLLLVAGIVSYVVLQIRLGRRGAAVGPAVDAPPPVRGGWPAQVALVVVGLGLLVLGARWLVNGAVAGAQAMGVSELVIGLTVVAVGTSMPEIATALLATFRGQRDLAIGNVVGSNIFNLLAILGLSAVVSPGGLPVAHAAAAFDIPVMVAAAVACLPIAFTGYVIARWEGGLFLGLYVAYTVYVVLNATEHDALPAYSTVMGAFVLPLAAATLLVLALNAYRRQRGPGPSPGG
ncbi:MAG: calcium/sodium antiporter [Gemmatimonadetes bacterium]|nr:calcium/sodium antiporter [Gemmatimonadota bacterium]